MPLEVDMESAQRDGYTVVDSVLSEEECTEFRDRLDDYAHGARVAPDGLGVQREPTASRGQIQTAQGEDIRKISGVQRDELFRTLVTRPTIVDVLKRLIGAELELYRADVLMKPALVGSAKGMHQDSPYWPISPMALWSCWVPFDPATEESGCMEVIPGSQNGGARDHVKVLDDYVIPESEYSPGDLVKVPMNPGAGLFFHSLLIHRTGPNKSPYPRRAITMSYMGSDYRYTGTGRRPAYMRIESGAPANPDDSVT